MTRWTLANKTALVTGATAGIGLAIAEELARHGATVIRVARGVEADMQADVTSPDDRKRIISSLDRLDILINNAGTNVRKRPSSTTTTSTCASARRTWTPSSSSAAWPIRF